MRYELPRLSYKFFAQAAMLARVPSSYIGREIADQFRIVERIGAGGMGSVYRAEQPEMNRSVAIKILHAKYLSRADLVSRFRREARAMSHLSHPNTARVFLYGQLEDGACYFVMEYLEGHNLAQEVRRNGPMDVARALKIMTPVAGALEEAHQAGIIHRDLKPENIFLTTQGGITDYPKVLDFGLAKVSEKQMAPGSMMLTREGMVFGTPEFMSPEQAQGQTLDGRSDIYSLGIILYELLTGKLPFEAKHSMEFIKHQVATAPIPISARVPGLSFPRSVELIIERALAKKPSQRYASAAEMAEAMQAALDQRHLSAEDRRRGAAISSIGGAAERLSELPTHAEVANEAVLDDDPLPGVPVGWIVAGLAVAIGVIGGLVFWIG